MSVMKRLNYEVRVAGRRASASEAFYSGRPADPAVPTPAEPEPGPPPEAPGSGEIARSVARAVKERLDAEIEAFRAAREAKAEREAIQALAREEEAEELARRPRVFAPDPPDFPRTRPRTPPRPSAAEMVARAESHEGLACPIAHASAARADRRELARVLAGEPSPGVARLRDELGPPRAPAVNTGWYETGDGAYCRVGSAPFPEYRYPGLSWRLHWTHPKPDDVPWEDEAPAVVDQVVAEPEPAPPHRRSRPRPEPAQAVFAW